MAAIQPHRNRNIGQKLGFDVVDAGQIPWDDRFQVGEQLIEWLDAYNVVAVVVEQFILREGRAQQQVGSTFPSVLVSGIVESVLNSRGQLSLMHYQQPSQALRAQVLPEHAELLSGMNHAADAYRHARIWMLLHKDQFREDTISLSSKSN